MKKLNIIWIVVDSVRTYRSSNDDRDRIAIMDKLGEESIEFTNAITGAPSSILSAASMFTALPSVFISRHFNDWSFNKKYINSIVNTLKESGYSIYSILNSKEERRVQKNLVFPIEAKYYPKGISHRNWWTNEELTNILKNVLVKRNKEAPGFYLLWYDCREDPTVSFHVERALELFKEHNLYENSIIIMNSDHGYPDPSTGLTEETMKKYSHDMIITDDNIKVPLFIKYPGCPKNKKINSVVGTIDITPTILDILEISQINQGYNYVGESLIPYLNTNNKQEKRLIRTDTRLALADGRVTSLRSNQYKYVFYWDEHIEELYNLIEDPFEINNLLPTNSVDLNSHLKYCHTYLREMEDDVNSLHVKELKENYTNEIRNTISSLDISNHKKSILLIAKYAHVTILKCFIDAVKEDFNGIKIDYISEIDENQFESKNLQFRKIYDLNKLLIENQQINLKEVGSYDIVFYITENSKNIFIDKNILGIIKKLKIKKSIMVDYNFNTYNRLFSNWNAAKRFIDRNIYFYGQEPMLIIDDIYFLIKTLFKNIFYNVKKDPVQADKVKRMRDRKLKVVE